MSIPGRKPPLTEGEIDWSEPDHIPQSGSAPMKFDENDLPGQTVQYHCLMLYIFIHQYSLNCPQQKTPLVNKIT